MLRTYRTADLCFFLHMQKVGFLMTRLVLNSQALIYIFPVFRFFDHGYMFDRVVHLVTEAEH